MPGRSREGWAGLEGLGSLESLERPGRGDACKIGYCSS